MVQKGKGIEKEQEKLIDDGGVVMPLGVVGDSKMSGEEPPLEVHYTQDKTQFESIQDSLNTLTEFLFYSEFKVIYKRGGTLFIEMSALERKRGRVEV